MFSTDSMAKKAPAPETSSNRKSAVILSRDAMAALGGAEPGRSLLERGAGIADNRLDSDLLDGRERVRFMAIVAIGVLGLEKVFWRRDGNATRTDTGLAMGAGGVQCGPGIAN